MTRRLLLLVLLLALPKFALAQREPIPPTEADVAYGPHERNVLDFWKPQSDRPTPLVVYIHGGGFVGGDKKSISPQVVRWCLDHKIALAAIHYRFVTTDIFPAPFHDSARALQFLRSRAKEWNIDPKRVAAFGGSAGAGISLWLGFHDDLARPDSADPAERESTRLVAVGSLGGQITYDPLIIRDLIGGRAWEHPSLAKVVGMPTPQAAVDAGEDIRRLFAECAAITHLSADDPPMFMIYSEPDIAPPADSRPGQFIHHPKFGHALKEAMDNLGVEAVYRHTDERQDKPPQLEMLEFFERQFAS